MYKKTCKDRSESIRKEKKSRRSGDRDSNRTPMTPHGNLTAYGYDSHSRLSKVGPSENNSDASYSYSKIDRLAECTLRNGITNSYSHGGANFIISSFRVLISNTRKRRNFYLFIELIGLECMMNY